MFLRRIWKYLLHLTYCRHRQGRGIHMPFAFSLVHDSLFNNNNYRVPGVVSDLHNGLLQDRQELAEQEFGAGRAGRASGPRTVRSFARHASVPSSTGRLLYRLSAWYQPSVILELGTGLGISTLYLASGNPDADLYTVEGDATKQQIARSLISRAGLERVRFLEGNIDQFLEFLGSQVQGKYLVFLDADHRYGPVIHNLSQLIQRLRGQEGLIILDDIYWSPEMERVWKEVRQWSEVSISIDLFHLGVLVLREDLHRTSFKIKI